MARDATPLRLKCEGMQHRFGTASKEMLRGDMLGQEVGDEAVIPDAAVVGSKMDHRAGLMEIIHAGREIVRTHSVVERNTLNAAARRQSAVAARTEQFADVRQER